MEKAGLKACIDQVRNDRSLTECLSMIINAEYDELFSNSNEWYNEICPYLKKNSTPEGISQSLLTLSHFCHFTFLSERIDVEVDLKKRILELGDRIAEGHALMKQHPQYAPVVFAAEAAFYIYVGSLNVKLNKKHRSLHANRAALESSSSLFALCYDLSLRASTHFVDMTTAPSTNESKVLAQAERLNALNSAVSGAVLVDRFFCGQLSDRSSQSAADGWNAKLPNLIAESQACIKKTLDIKESSALLNALTYSSPDIAFSSGVPTLTNLLPLFERVILSSFDLQSLVWCVVYIKRLFQVSASQQYVDALIVEALAKGEALRRCAHLPSSLAGDFSTPSADALCQLDVVSFVLMAAGRVELSLPPVAEGTSDGILPPFLTNTLGSNELGGEMSWLTTSQVQWWKAVMTTPQTNAPGQDPFTKFRLIQDGLFILRFSGIDAKLLPLAVRVADGFQAFVMDQYFNISRQDWPRKVSLPADVRRFHAYCYKCWEGLSQFMHSNRSASHGHHSQRMSLGSASTTPSRQQRFFDPFPTAGTLDTLGGGAVPSELKNHISVLSNFYLGFDALLNGNYEASVKFLKVCSNDLTLACYFAGRAFEFMAGEAHEKNLRMPSSSSWVVRQLYESALTAYEKATNYALSRVQQVPRVVVAEGAAKGVARVKKHLHIGASSGKAVVKEEAVATPVNGGCESATSSESPVSSAVFTQQQQAFASIQQKQEQSLSQLNNTVSQLAPAIRDLSSAARDLSDVARQLRDLERQLRESVVRMECGIQQQQQRPPSSAATATPPVTGGGPPAGGVTVDQLLPLLMDLIRDRNMPVQQFPPAYMSPNVPGQQSGLLMRQLGAGGPAGVGIVSGPSDQMPPPGIIPGNYPPGQSLVSHMPPSSFGMVRPDTPDNVPTTGSCQFQPQPPPLSSNPTIPPPLQSSSAFTSVAQHQPRMPPPSTLAASTRPAAPASATTPSTAGTKPSKEQSTPQQPQQGRSLAELFRPPTGSWKCDTCLVQNNEAAQMCVACETPRPSADGSVAAAPKPSKPLPQIMFPPPSSATQKPPAQSSPAMPAFGFAKPAGESPASTTTPVFGAKPPATASTTPASSGAITFGASPLFGAKPAVATSTTTATTGTTPTAAVTKPAQATLGFGAQQKTETPKADAAKGDEVEESPEAFVPTAEYTPVTTLPQNYTVVTGEEDEERLFSEKAKLYRWAENTGEWKERGIGEMRVLKNAKTGLARILMRREQVLKPCANHQITADLVLRPFAAVGDRGFCWLAPDFAEVEPGEPAQVLKLAIRFRNSESAQQFQKVVESCRTNSPKADASKPQPQSPPQKPTASATPTPATVATTAALPPASTGSSIAPVFGSSFIKQENTAASTPSSSFSFAALAAANATKKPESESSPKPAAASGASPFVGQAEPLFKSLLSKTSEQGIKSAASPGGDVGAEAADDSEQPESFVPTSEYKPVIQLPSDYKKVTGEEGYERALSERCKLYRWDSGSGEWKERGIGDIRLLRSSEGASKFRIVMRREFIHTVCANHFLTTTPSMRLGRLPAAADRAVTWFAPNDFSDDEAKHETLCARFKTPALADQFTASFEKALNELAGKDGGENSAAKPSTDSPGQQQVEKGVKSENVAGNGDGAKTATPGFSFAAPQNRTSAASTKLFGSVASTAPTSITQPPSAPFSGFRFGALGTTGGPAPPPATTSANPLFGPGAFGGGAPPPGGAFSFGGTAFSTGGAQQPSEGGGNAKPNGGGTALKGTDEDIDCELVGVTHANPDEVAQARQYLLPDDFYLYRLRKPCNGCPGCERDGNFHDSIGNNNENLSTSTAAASSTSTIAFNSGKQQQNAAPLNVKSNSTTTASVASNPGSGNSTLKSQIPTFSFK